jgi:hypothetical protein
MSAYSKQLHLSENNLARVSQATQPTLKHPFVLCSAPRSPISCGLPIFIPESAAKFNRQEPPAHPRCVALLQRSVIRKGLS